MLRANIHSCISDVLNFHAQYHKLKPALAYIWFLCYSKFQACRMKYGQTHTRQTIFSSPIPQRAVTACVWMGDSLYRGGISCSVTGHRDFTAVSIKTFTPPSLQWKPGWLPWTGQQVDYQTHQQVLLCYYYVYFADVTRIFFSLFLSFSLQWKSNNLFPTHNKSFL